MKKISLISLIVLFTCIALAQSKDKSAFKKFIGTWSYVNDTIEFTINLARDSTNSNLLSGYYSVVNRGDTLIGNSNKHNSWSSKTLLGFELLVARGKDELDTNAIFVKIDDVYKGFKSTRGTFKLTDDSNKAVLKLNPAGDDRHKLFIDGEPIGWHSPGTWPFPTSCTMTRIEPTMSKK